MESQLELLTGRLYAQAVGDRRNVASMALALRNEAARAAGRAALASVNDYLAEVAGRSVCLTLLAGSGSRWVKSLAAKDGRPIELAAEAAAFDPARPRGLFPVRDLLGDKRSSGRIPIASYALAATEGLGRRVIVVRGWEAEIEAEILGPLGADPASAAFFTQAAPYGKPLGHGDAAWQCRSLWSGADYVIANFGGDANSRRTVLSSLLALDALRSSGLAVDLLLPATRLPAPAYPIQLDAGGLPRSFGHAKLQGHLGPEPAGFGYTNVGLRVYSAPALLEAVLSFRERYWVEGAGYAIPGNDPEGREFALDNVDALLASEGRARILAIAKPEELTPAKSVDDLPAFERAIRSVVEEDRLSSFPAAARVNNS
jgi:hypothetical protein